MCDCVKSFNFQDTGSLIKNEIYFTNIVHLENIIVATVATTVTNPTVNDAIPSAVDDEASSGKSSFPRCGHCVATNDVCVGDQRPAAIPISKKTNTKC